MANIVLVCVAGVSGTFLANHMRRLDAELHARVTTLAGLAALDEGDVVLVAPQLAASLDRVRELAAPRPVGLLAQGTGPEGAAAAVAQARDLLARSAYRGNPNLELKE